MNMEGCVWSWDRIACDWCSVIKSSPALCHPMDCSTPGFSVLHYLLEFAQTHALCQWCYPSISSSVDPFSSCLLSFPASGSFLVNQFFASGNFSFSISPSNEYSGLISFSWLVWSCCPRGSRVFFSTTVWKHQFFGTQPSLWSSSHIHTWLLE